MSAAKLYELKVDLAELNKLLNLVERQRVKDLIIIEIRKVETEIANINDSLKMEVDTTGIDSAPKKIITPASNRCYDVKISNYAWDQSDKFVKLFVTLNKVHTIPEDNIHCNFEISSVEMVAKELENRNYIFTMKNLLENIDVANSKWKVKKDMVVIFLAKAQNNKWTYLTTVEKKAKEPKSSLPKMDPNEDPTTGLMDLMKKMYEEGDDDMKRTIAQSWTESANKSKMGW